MQARDIIFSNPPVDLYYEETLPTKTGQLMFAMEYLPVSMIRELILRLRGFSCLRWGKAHSKDSQAHSAGWRIGPAELDKIKITV